MGFIKKELEKVFVRVKDFSKIENIGEALNLLKQNEAQQRISAVIIIYSEIDFNEFYKKHCARIPNDENEFTVLVRGEESIPTRGEIRSLLEELLKTRFTIESGMIIIDIFENLKEKYSVRKFYDGKFISEPVKGSFRFRNISLNVSRRELEYLKNKNILTEEQYKEIDNLWKSSFTEKGKNFFKKIWLIEHTDLIIKKKKLFF